MANPQPDQFTKLSNEIIKQIMISKFSKRQLSILKLIWRCSYGFGKKVAKLLKSDYRAAGVDPSDIKEELNYLEKSRVIYWDEENDLVAFNKDYDQWRISLSKTALKADFDKILQRQFEDMKSSSTENEGIKKLLESDEKRAKQDEEFGNVPNNDRSEFGTSPNDNKEELGNVPNDDKKEFGKVPNRNKNDLVKYQTDNQDEPYDDNDNGGPKEIKHKEINNKNIRNVRKDIIDINSHNMQKSEENQQDDQEQSEAQEHNQESKSDAEQILNYARQKIITNQLAYESLIRDDLEDYSKQVLKRAIDLAVEQQEESENYKRGDPKNGVDIGSWRYIQCFIEQAQKELKGGNQNGRGSESNQQGNGESSKDEGARLQEKAFKLMGFKEE